MLVKQSSQIKASSSELFKFLLDIQNRKKFIPALEEIILIDPLPIRIGSRYTEIAQIAGRRLKTTYQITALQKNKRISAKSIKSIFPIQADLLLKDQSNTTSLTIFLDFELKGIFLLASGLIKIIVTNQTNTILLRIKSQVEKNINA